MKRGPTKISFSYNNNSIRNLGNNYGQIGFPRVDILRKSSILNRIDFKTNIVKTAAVRLPTKSNPENEAGNRSVHFEINQS